MKAQSQLRPKLSGGKILVLVAAAAGVFLLLNREVDTPVVDLPEDSAEPFEQLEEDLLESPEIREEVPAAEATPVVELLPATVETEMRRDLGETAGLGYICGRVVTEAGEPLNDAQVSWTGWDRRFLPYVFASVAIPPQEIAENSVVVLTDPQGNFRLDKLPLLLPEEPSYLWVTHGTHEAHMIEYDPGVTGVEGELVVELKPAQAMVVNVVSGEVPVSGAFVFQQVAFPRDSNAPMEGGSHAPKGLLVFLRQLETDNKGRGSLAPAPHQHRVFATHGELRSPPWRGTGTPSVELELNPSCTLSGYVGFPTDYDPAWGMPHVRVSRSYGPFLEEVATIIVHPDGTIGPGNVPVLPAEEYLLYLDGGRFVPDQRTIPTPDVGQDLRVKFKGEMGATVWFQGLDENGEGLPDAKLVVGWQEASGRVEKTVRARPDGYLRLMGVPAGVIDGVISAKGRNRIRTGPLTVPELEQAVHPFVLRPSLKLTGRCFDGIDPASNFEVRYWGVGKQGSRGTVRVFDSQDGAFVIEDVSWQKVALEAISKEFGRSDVVTLDITDSEREEVILNIRPPLAMTGIVVQSGVGEPISGAMVDVYNAQVQYELDPIGASVTTGANGKFDVRRLGPGRNIISVSAQGYSTRELEVVAKGDTSDLGKIALTKSQPLTARLVLPEGQDTATYVLSAMGIGAIPTTNFDSGGELRIEEASAGSYLFHVRDNDGMLKTLMSLRRTLVPGETWHLEFNVAGSERNIRVETTGVEPAGTATEYTAGVTYVDLDGNENFQAVPLDPTGSAVVRGNVGEGSISVRITATHGNTAGGTAQTIGVDDPPETVIHVALESKLVHVRVVDAAGKPLSGIEILPRSSASGGMVLGWQVTDAKGEAHFRTLPPQTDEVTLAAASGGTIDRVPFQYPTEEGEWVELVFDMSSSMTFFLHDGGVPLSDASCRLFSGEHGYTLTPSRTPDADGRVTFSDLGPGSYDLHVEAPDRWSLVQGVQATPAGSEYSVEVRRVGTLVLEFETSSGGPYAGGPVALEFVPLSQQVGSWAKTGKLPGHSEQLRTDAGGLLQLEGIPHGEYRWTCAGASGAVVLEPGAVTRTKVSFRQACARHRKLATTAQSGAGSPPASVSA